jgi:hypothetical protein
MKAKLALRPAPLARIQRQPASPVVAHTPPSQPALRIIDGGTLLRLQSTAGNQAVGELIARPRLTVQTQAVACPPPPAPAPPMAPQQDPHFVAVKDRVEGEAVKQKQHPSPKAKVAESEKAAQGPTNEVAGKAAANQVDEMSQQKPKGFDKAAFIAAVHTAIEKATPKNMEEVDDFQKSGKAGQLKDQVVGTVSQNKDAAAKDIKQASAAAPSQSGIPAKPVTPMQPEAPGRAPADVRPGDAMPPPKPAEQVSLDHTSCETDSQLAEAKVTDEQVAKSNEPQFHEAMTAKKEADQHAGTAPQQFREDEQKQLDETKGAAGAATAAGMSQMHQSRTSALGHVGSHKDDAKAKNEAERARVSSEIEGIYNTTKKDVDGILSGLDKSVADTFDSGEKLARDAFEKDYKTKKDAYFEKRYSGFEGAGLWVADKLTSPPPEVNAFIDQAKQLYTNKMEGVINQVATLVETELNKATKRIADGRQQIKDYVAKQPKELQKVASEAATQISSKFDDLDQAVTDKAEAVVDDLADKYVAAAQEVDERCNAMREENKGLLDKAKDKVAGMVETLKKMEEMLAQLAAKAESVVDQILQDPIGFLGNLVNAVKQGFQQFTGNILKHLAQGLMGWLLGELADAGITMPESFDLKGILHLVAQILGLTWANIRARAAAMLGEEVVGMIEQGVEVFQKIVHIFTTLRDQGLAGLWEMIADKIGDLKAQVMDQIQDFVITKVITAGVTWIIGLLNPASAFVKACKAIYDIVMFFIERGSQIMALVSAILDNLAAIASGNISAAANLVESVLGKAIPVVIGFLASLLGVGGISEKIKEVINAVRKPINKAVDWLLKTVVKPVAKLAARAIGFVKGKVKSGVDWLKKKAKAGVGAIKSKLTKTKADGRTPDQKRVDMDAALTEATGLTKDSSKSTDEIRSRLPTIKSSHGLSALELVVDNKDKEHESLHVEGAMSPRRPGERIHRDYTGEKHMVVSITSDLKLPPQKVRLGYEEDLPRQGEYPPGTFGHAVMHRAHGQGKITGRESAMGIRLAPFEVNIILQEHGIEAFIRKIAERLRSDPHVTAIPYNTEIRTIEKTLRLDSIVYQLDAIVNGREQTILVATIRVGGTGTQPTAKASISEIGPEWVGFLYETAASIPTMAERLGVSA